MPARRQGFDCELVGLEVENLRGFKRSRLNLERPLTVLVGPNNSGKTSLLRLLDWAVNGTDDALLSGDRSRSADEDALLLPARETRGAARRLTLLVRIPDGRRARRFDAVDGRARLRLKVAVAGVYAAVSKPTRSEPKESEDRAIELLHALRARTSLLVVPSARDAASDRFRRTLGLAIRAKLGERGLHSQRGGAPLEYRRIKAALEEVEAVGSELVSPLWAELQKSLPPGLATDGSVKFATSPADLVNWLVDQASFSLTTGAHDERTVSPAEVGSGLQSVLDLALLEAVAELDGNSLLLLEEPEAFLHPSAQRSFAVKLFADRPVRRIVSTHSPIVIDEARYGDVVLVRDHRIFEPVVRDERRDDINSALLTGSGAEALYSRSVLLVEGAGDRAFFEALRRRIAAIDPSGRVDSLRAVTVGGAERFRPWAQLLQSYADTASGELPVRWLAVADSVDATSALARGIREAGLVLPAAVARRITRVRPAFRDEGDRAGIAATRQVNRAAAGLRAPIYLLPVDLEWAALHRIKGGTVKQVSELLRYADNPDRDTLLRRLGSKYGAGPVERPEKAEWVRAALGARLPRREISADVIRLLRRWLRGAIESTPEVEALIDAVW